MPARSSLTLVNAQRDMMSQVGPTFLLFILACLARVLATSWHGLGNDEAQCLAVATLPSWHAMLAEISADGNPPLWYLLLRGWTSLAGTSDLALKVLPFFISAWVPPLSYLVFKRFLNQRFLPFLCALLLCISPALIVQCHLLRPYGLMTLFGLLATWQWYELLAGKGTRTNACCYAVLLSLSAWTHPYALMVPAGHALATLYVVINGKTERRRLILYASAVVAAALSFAPWLPVLPAARANQQALWTWRLPPLDIAQAAAYFLFQYVDETARQKVEVPVCALVFFLSLLAFPMRRLVSGADQLQRRRLIHLATAGGFAFYMALSLSAPFFRDRYLPPLMPFATMVVLMFVETLLRPLTQRRHFAVAGAAALLFVPLWIPQLITLHAEPFSSGRLAVSALLPRIDARKDLVVCAFEPQMPEFNRLFPPEVRIVSFPDVSRVRLVEWHGLDERIRNPENYRQLEAMMEQTLQAGGKVWEILQYTDLHPPDALPAGLDHREAEVVASRRIFDWLSHHAGQIGYAYARSQENTLFITDFERR